jgi:demethylspheroidene O-methyltransferase
LLAAVQVGLLDRLRAGPCDAAGLALLSGLSEAASLRLMRAAAALDLAEAVAPGWWMLGQRGAALQANPGALAMVRHHTLLYADLADPVALLCATGLSRPRFRVLALCRRCSAPEAGAYSALMASSQAMVAQQALGAYRFARHRRLLDVGGGHGAFVSAVRAACPALDLGVFDLPPVIAGAAARLGDAMALHPAIFPRCAAAGL